MADQILTTSEAAELIGTTTRRILKACQDGVLTGTKSGWVWLIKLEDLNKWAKKQRKLSTNR